METITLNMTPSASLTTCHASQYDIGRQVRFNLVNGADDFVLSGGETVTLKIRRADGVFVEKQVPNTSSNYVIWTSVAGECDAAGISECELSVTDGGDLLGSANFWMEVEPDAYSEGAVVIRRATGDPAIFETDLPDVAAECVLELGYNAEGYTRATVINSETAPAQDAAPYLFRKSGGDLPSNGSQDFDKIVGGTVAFNQIVPALSLMGSVGCSYSVADNVATCTVNATGVSNKRIQVSRSYGFTTEPMPNHKYFMQAFVKSETALSEAILYWGNNVKINNQSLTQDAWNEVSGIATHASPTGKYVQIYVYNNNFAEDDVVYIKNWITIDLTQMFGSTIADYVYNLETATPGAGVAWFRVLFPAVYYATNAGELLSVKTSARVTTGKNLFNKDDADIVQGYISASGFNDTNTNARTVYIRIPAGSTITVSKIASARFTIATAPVIPAHGVAYTSRSVDNTATALTITAGAQDQYIWAWVYLNGTDTVTLDEVLNSLQIEIASEASEYSPYISHSYPLDSDLELRGLPKLDAANRLYFDGDTYESDGHVGRRYGILDMGTRAWSKTSDGIFSITILDRKYGEGNFNLLNYKYVTYTGAHSTGSNIAALVADNGNGLYVNKGSGTIFVADAAYTDSNAFRTAVSGIMLVYELATPASETADPYTNPQEVDAYGTEAYTDSRTVPMPVGHSTIYGDDLKAYIIDFGHTVYGGTLNLTTGELTGDKNADGSDKTPPDVYQITPRAVDIREGDNQIFGNTDGDITVDYYAKA